MNIVFLGPPGAGKGTQALRVSQSLGVPHVSTGDMFRAAIKEGTPLGKQVEALIASGGLVPDGLTNQLVAARLSQPDAAKGWLLDGYPRSVAQAEALETAYAVDAAVNIALRDEALIDRLAGRRVCSACGMATHVSKHSGAACPQCGGSLVQRPDDAPEAVANRLRLYHEVTAPLEAWYAQRGNLVTIDGDAPIGVVTEAILEALGRR